MPGVVRVTRNILDALPRGQHPMTGQLRTTFEGVASAAILCGLIQFASQYDLEVDTYGYAWAVYGTIFTTLVAFASLFAISRRGLRPVAWLWLAIYAVALGVTAHDFAVGILPDPRYLSGMLSIGADTIAACLIILWLFRTRREISDA